MKRISNPHVATDHGASGLCGPAGSCPGHVHFCDDHDLAYECPLCGTVTVWRIAAVEDSALRSAEAFPDTDTVALPPCSNCGALPFLNHSNVVYGLDLPHHYTLAATKLIADRPRLRGKIAVNAHAERDRYQGQDFSHLPPKQRPPHHVGADE